MQSEQPLITIFVPCYNEEGNVYQTLEIIREALTLTKIFGEVIVIDDASTDATVDWVKKFISENPEMLIRLHVCAKNMGFGENFGEAAFMGTGLYYRVVCGDNSEPVETLVRVFEKIGEADIILSYRPLDVVGKSLFRRLLSRVYTHIVNFLSGYRLHYYNGLPIFRRTDVIRWNPNSHGFGYQADLVTRLLDRGATYIEVPVTGNERPSGTAKAMTFRNFCSVAHSLLNIAIRRTSRIWWGRA